MRRAATQFRKDYLSAHDIIFFCAELTCLE